MAIRTRNLDVNASAHLQGSYMTSLGDITATTTRTIFVAPVPCVVTKIDYYSRQAVPGGSSTHLILQAKLLAGGSSVAQRSTSATTSVTDTNSVSAGFPYTLTPTSNNSLSVGAGIELIITQSGSAVSSCVAVHVIYTPLLHRESR